MPRTISFGQAIREGLEQAMAADDKVVVIGEGVPDPKAIFNTTAGLRDQFGAKRVFDMPLSENGVTGICIGAALRGLRPVMVHQRIDFALLAFDQLVNNAAKWHYMFDGKASVPLVVRLIVGRGWGQGPQHSQSLHALFAHIPGLKVVMPTTPHDAKGMLIAAIEDDNPVLFIEHRWLHNVADHVPAEAYRVPLHRARIMATGTDITVAAFSYIALECLAVAKALAPHGINVEVIDMRSVNPLDVATVAESVRKTGRLLVADIGNKTGGIAAELITAITEAEFSSLKNAPVRIGSPDHPVPTSHHMSSQSYPDARRIAEAILSMLGAPLSADQQAAISKALTKAEYHDVPSINFAGPF